MLTLQTSHSILVVSNKVTNVGNRALGQAKKPFTYPKLTITEPERILSLYDCNSFVFIPTTHQASFTLLFLHSDLPGHPPPMFFPCPGSAGFGFVMDFLASELGNNLFC